MIHALVLHDCIFFNQHMLTLIMLLPLFCDFILSHVLTLLLSTFSWEWMTCIVLMRRYTTTLTLCCSLHSAYQCRLNTSLICSCHSAPFHKLISFVLWIQYCEANDALQVQMLKRSWELSGYWSVTFRRVKMVYRCCKVWTVSACDLHLSKSVLQLCCMKAETCTSNQL